MKVLGYALPQVAVPGVQSRLYLHQAAMLDSWNDHMAFLLTTKTGSGKTRAVGLPVVQRRESALFMYPTNALITDQARALRQLLEEENISFRELEPENANEPYGDEEYMLARMSKDALEGFCEAWNMSRKGDALHRIVGGSKRRLVLTNPDTLYLLLSLRYRAAAESLAHLHGFSTIVFDEFHLYTGVELAHALWMLHLVRSFRPELRIVLLSATPNPQVTQHLEALLEPHVVGAQTPGVRPVTGERIVAHDVELLTLPALRENLVECCGAKLLALKDELLHLQAANTAANGRGDYVPAVVILNSVVDAIALEDALVAAGIAGIAREQIVPIRGLSARSVRDVKNKLIVIGTSAIEVGIDFQASYLLFEASDAASFMQRFGRIGRHCPGTAFLLCDYRVAQALRSLPDEVPRHEFEDIINDRWPQHDARAWFATTWGGMVSVRAQAHNFEQAVYRSHASEPHIKDEIKDWLCAALENYAYKLDAVGKLRQSQRYEKKPWFKDYAAIDTFRTSLVSQQVWDLAEQKRGRNEWHYDADVAMLLRRAEGLRFNSKTKRLEVSGYGAKHKVRFVKSFTDEPEIAGALQTTSDPNYPPDQMQFYQDDHLSPVSHVMHTPQHHIFVVVSHDDVQNALDWRITWFRCGSEGHFIIAFDGDALLLKELRDHNAT